MKSQKALKPRHQIRNIQTNFKTKLFDYTL